MEVNIHINVTTIITVGHKGIVIMIMYIRIWFQLVTNI